MSAKLRLCLFDQSPSPQDSLRTPFSQLRSVKIVGEYATWEGLQSCLCAGGADAVAVNLDGTGEQLSLQIVQRVSEVAPTCKIIGISASTNPQSIIAAMRAGCAQFVCRPIDPQDLNEAIESVRSTLMAAAPDSKRICVIGSSGGAGSTTVACNLALALAHLAERPCGLADLNLEFGDIACAFDVLPKYSISDACRDGAELDRAMLETILEELPSNVWILARPERHEDAREVTPEGVSHVLSLMGQMFPFVVIDVPRTGNLYAGAALNGADRVLIVTQLAVPFLRNATRLFDGLRSSGVPEQHIEIVLNRVNANFERITTDEVAKHFRRPVFASIPNDYRRVMESHDLGNPIVTDAPRSPARRAIQLMAEKLVSIDPPVAEAAAEGGLLGKLLGRRREATPP